MIGIPPSGRVFALELIEGTPSGVLNPIESPRCWFWLLQVRYLCVLAGHRLSVSLRQCIHFGTMFRHRILAYGYFLILLFHRLDRRRIQCRNFCRMFFLKARYFGPKFRFRVRLTILKACHWLERRVMAGIQPVTSDALGSFNKGGERLPKNQEEDCRNQNSGQRPKELSHI